MFCFCKSLKEFDSSELMEYFGPVVSTETHCISLVCGESLKDSSKDTVAES